MNFLKKEDPSKFKRQFSQWEKCLTSMKAKTCEEAYKAVHKKILADSDRKKAAKKGSKPKLDKEVGNTKIYKNSKGAKFVRYRKLTGAERKAAVQAKFAAIMG